MFFHLFELKYFLKILLLRTLHRQQEEDYLGLPVFSLFLVSCSPSISVKAENSDAATIGFSANFSLSANSAFKEFLDLAQENSGLAENTNSTLFSKQELENFLISAGAKNVSVNVEKDGKTSASGKIENLSKSILASSKILSKTSVPEKYFKEFPFANCP